MSNDEIVTLLSHYEKSIKAIKSEALQLCWYMRGGLSYDESMSLSRTEQDIIHDLIKENLKTTKESGLPFF